jgi:hypothetical protein
MVFNKYTALFYLKVGVELLLLPILYPLEGLKKIFSAKGDLQKAKLRPPVIDKLIYVCIHEWGGYDMKRRKKIKNGKYFECGLYYQLKRYRDRAQGFDVNLTVTMSEIEKHRQLAYVRENTDLVLDVKNQGMDFSGYSAFYDRIKDHPNAYVILSNSSVEQDQQKFLSVYIKYMEDNPDVGILGVSYCTKIYQTFVRNNFNPHLQSFFYLTTTAVLKEIVSENGGRFPGGNIDHKLLLIRSGEVKVSKLAMKLGYNLAVVQESGVVYKFGKKNIWDNGYKNWKLAMGDVRQISSHPNRINQIQSDAANVDRLQYKIQ